jgi:hypothetical protein
MHFPKSPIYIIAKLLVNYFYFIIKYFQSFNKPVVIEKPHIETKYEKSCKKYAELYKKETEDENSNIDPLLYDYDKRKELFSDSENIYEKQWKTRILIENTPRGNVMMYYNPYLLSYQYYSDEQSFPFKILEEVATKYVTMFRCKDFFIDMENRPQNKMLDILQREEDALKTKKMKINDITKCVNIQSESKDVFASLKNYREEPKKESGPRGTKRKTVDEKGPKFSNKYARIGKLCDFNIVQKPPDKKIQAVNELMFGEKPVNKVIDFFDDDLEIVETPSKSAYNLFKSKGTYN